jgi:hypothetical protein
MTKSIGIYELLAKLSGLSVAEVRWSMLRYGELTRGQGLSREDAKSILREEMKTKPWLTANEKGAR